MASFDLTEPDYPRAVLVALVLVSALALLVAASTSSASFGAYNAGWNGASNLRSQADAVGAETVIARNVSTYREGQANRTVAVVLAPESRYGDREVTRLRQFVAAGGRLVIAGDFGTPTNALLRELGARARLNGSLLRDERRYHRSPAMPIADNVSEGPLTSGVDQLTLNYGTAVEPNGASVLVRTSEFAYLDTNRNGALDTNESLGSYPVATIERIGQGRVIVVGDASVLINAMLDRSGNRAFVRGLFGGYERVLLDYSHAERLPPVALLVLVLRESALLQVIVGGAAIGLVGAWARWPALSERIEDRPVVDRLRRGLPEGIRPASHPSPLPLEEEEIVALLERRHPEWDEERLRRVAQGLITQHRKERDDDRSG